MPQSGRSHLRDLLPKFEHIRVLRALPGARRDLPLRGVAQRWPPAAGWWDRPPGDAQAADAQPASMPQRSRTALRGSRPNGSCVGATSGSCSPTTSPKSAATTSSHVVCLGITTQGVKIPLGLWEGPTENATVVTALLSDLVGAGVGSRAGDPVRPRRRESPEERESGWCSGGDVVVQRCIRHYADSRVMPRRVRNRCSQAGSGRVRSA